MKRRIPKPILPMVDFGNKLFGTVFKGSIRNALISSHPAVERNKQGFCSRLQVSPDFERLDARHFRAWQDRSELSMSKDQVIAETMKNGEGCGDLSTLLAQIVRQITTADRYLSTLSRRRYDKCHIENTTFVTLIYSEFAVQ
jgi:hypothetical protein